MFVKKFRDIGLQLEMNRWPVDPLVISANLRGLFHQQVRAGIDEDEMLAWNDNRYRTRGKIARQCQSIMRGIEVGIVLWSEQLGRYPDFGKPFLIKQDGEGIHQDQGLEARFRRRLPVGNQIACLRCRRPILRAAGAGVLAAFAGAIVRCQLEVGLGAGQNEAGIAAGGIADHAHTVRIDGA